MEHGPLAQALMATNRGSQGPNLPRNARISSQSFCDVEEDFLDTHGLGSAVVAGGFAGMMEHIVMFPVDTIKTRLQTRHLPGAPQYEGIRHAMTEMLKTEGVFSLYRGARAVITASFPSHGFYFATYEAVKEVLGANQPGFHVVATAVAGGCATVAHDVVATPLDVIKQRLQVYGSRYRGILHCALHITRKEGVRALWASYPTTVVMNVPYQAMHFTTYEAAKTMLSGEEGEHGLREEALAGGLAGSLAAMVSTPLDVVKTHIQTRGMLTDVGPQLPQGAARRRIVILRPKVHLKYPLAMGAYATFMHILRVDGARGLFRGAGARVLYFAPSAAVVWTTYESIKRAMQ